MNEGKPSYTIHPPDYHSAIEEGSEFYIQFHRLNEEVESLLIRIIHRYLEQYDILYLRDSIITVMKELINNAVKANLKRLFFKNRDLDIDNEDDYRLGMEAFKDVVFGEEEKEYFARLDTSKLVVRVSFYVSEYQIHISVINNMPILDSELAKIRGRVDKAYRYKDISEAFNDVLDDSEGAGLGLIMALMLFKNCGLNQDSFRIYRKKNLTISTISIPKMYSEQDKQVEVTRELLRELDDIPAFPENIREIQRLMADKESSMKDIGKAIARDPGLTASMLKLANSAGYMTVTRVETIEEAATIIGSKGINALLVASGVHDIFDKRYKRFELIWKDSEKRAFYAQKISIQLKYNKLSEYAYLSALLADLGLIIINSLNPEIMQRLKEITGYKGIEDTSLIEEISLGISHSSIGASIARKWKFNEALTHAIEFHHRPYVAPEEYQELIYIVYLADAFVEIDKGKMKFSTLDEDVLKYFRLEEKPEFDRLHQTLIKALEKQHEETAAT